ncbi:DsbA family protein [Streptomyces sp. NPDC048434]|uniref:DsbA family protein n=1 Tax=Streptomyces sp. NPDC048434 TaxID=3365549 RepID=UPI003720C482
MRAKAVSRPARVPAGANEEGDGVMVGEGPVDVDVYIDFQCPFCRHFEEVSGPVLDQLVAENLITIIFHPLAFLDAMSTTRYSTRASAAAGCAADSGRFRDYVRALFADQPPEGGVGLDDQQLVDIGAGVGMTEATFAACVHGGVHLDWPPYVTAWAVEHGVAGTPTVFVNSMAISPHPGLIRAAVHATARTGA